MTGAPLFLDIATSSGHSLGLSWIIWIRAAAFSLLMSASYFILASQAWHMGLFGVVWALGAVIPAARALYGRARGGY